MFSPLEAFVLSDSPIVTTWVVVLAMGIVLLTGSMMLLLGVAGSVVPSSRASALSEAAGLAVLGLVTGLAGADSGLVSLVTAVFVLVLSLNLVGALPFVLALTSAFGVTLALSIGLSLAGLALALLARREAALASLLPSGCPDGMAPMIVAIEIVGLIARTCALGIRLAANITAGHTLMALLSVAFWSVFTMALTSPAISMAWIGTLLALGVALSALLVLFALELAVCFIQAYVFVLILTQIVDSRVTGSLGCGFIPQQPKCMRLSFIESCRAVAAAIATSSAYVQPTCPSTGRSGGLVKRELDLADGETHAHAAGPDYTPCS